MDVFAAQEVFKRFEIITVPSRESYAANCLAINGKVLMSKGFPETKKKILSKGFTIFEVEMSEFQKMDGGLTCLSIIF